uniref:Uncharacterized protein n=1 Tax=Arundo donax TaxID=35708 RepID=A0A0A9C7N9_ARUDO
MMFCSNTPWRMVSLLRHPSPTGSQHRRPLLPLHRSLKITFCNITPWRMGSLLHHPSPTGS